MNRLSNKYSLILPVMLLVALILARCSNDRVMDDTMNSYTQITQDEAGERMSYDDEDIDWDAFVRSVPTLVIEANGRILYADLEENDSAQAFVEKLSPQRITVEMHDYGNFEKVGTLPWSLPQNNQSITTEPGDIMLYQGDQITIYYDQNTWELTKLAEMGSKTRDDLLEVLGDGDVTVDMWLEWSE